MFLSVIRALLANRHRLERRGGRKWEKGEERKKWGKRKRRQGNKMEEEEIREGRMYGEGGRRKEVREGGNIRQEVV